MQELRMHQLRIFVLVSKYHIYPATRFLIKGNNTYIFICKNLSLPKLTSLTSIIANKLQGNQIKNSMGGFFPGGIFLGGIFPGGFFLGGFFLVYFYLNCLLFIDQTQNIENHETENNNC